VNKRLLLVAVLPLLCASCAFMNPRNRRLMNATEGALVPESTAWKVVTAPVVLPACLAAGVLDTVVVHPATTLDDAWYDTGAMLWQPTSRGFVTESALLPFRAAATPPLWALRFASRALLDIPPWPPSPARLERLLLKQSPEDRLDTMQQLSRWTYTGEDLEPATQVMLRACRRHAEETAFCEATLLRLPRPLTPDARAYLATQTQTGAGRVCAAAIERLFIDSLYTPRSDEEKAKATTHRQEIVEALARVYDGLVKGGHREAEVYLIGMTGYNIRPPRGSSNNPMAEEPSGPMALGLHIAHSLAQRSNPDYAAAVAFLMRGRLLHYMHAARIDAMMHEWRPLTLLPGWPMMVARAIQQQQQEQQSGRPEAFQVRITALLEKQRALGEELRTSEPSEALKRVYRSHELAAVATALDAERMARRLLEGPKRDLELFMGDPLDLLRQRGTLER
jgi:hypothetical protein